MSDTQTSPGWLSGSPAAVADAANLWARQLRLIQCELTMKESLEQKRVLPSHIENTWREIDLFLDSLPDTNASVGPLTDLIDVVQVTHHVLRCAADDLTEQFDGNSLSQSVFDSTAEQLGVVASRLAETAANLLTTTEPAATPSESPQTGSVSP